MKAPDRIWLSASYNYVVWTEEPAHLETRVEYLRATPALLALIEAAKAWDTQYPRYVGAGTKVLNAAYTYAKSQDHPDAG